jgi:hypothetical protein
MKSPSDEHLGCHFLHRLVDLHDHIVVQRKFALALNAVFQMVVVGHFVAGEIPLNVGSVIGAIVGCWLVFMLSLIPRAIGMTRARRPIDRQEFTASVFEDIYLQRADVNHKPEATEVVRLLIDAGIGVGKYEGYSRPPIFWHKAAAAANQLYAWLQQNPATSREDRLNAARKVVDMNRLVHHSLRMG